MNMCKCLSRLSATLFVRGSAWPAPGPSWLLKFALPLDMQRIPLGSIGMVSGLKNAEKGRIDMCRENPCLWKRHYIARKRWNSVDMVSLSFLQWSKLWGTRNKGKTPIVLLVLLGSFCSFSDLPYSALYLQKRKCCPFCVFIDFGRPQKQTK